MSLSKFSRLLAELKSEKNEFEKENLKGKELLKTLKGGGEGALGDGYESAAQGNQGEAAQSHSKNTSDRNLKKIFTILTKNEREKSEMCLFFSDASTGKDQDAIKRLFFKRFLNPMLSVEFLEEFAHLSFISLGCYDDILELYFASHAAVSNSKPKTTDQLSGSSLIRVSLDELADKMIDLLLLHLKDDSANSTSSHLHPTITLSKLLQIRGGGSRLTLNQMESLLFIASSFTKPANDATADTANQLISCLQLVATHNFIMFLNSDTLLDFVLKIALMIADDQLPPPISSRAITRPARINVLISLFKGFAKASRLPELIKKCLGLVKIPPTTTTELSSTLESLLVLLDPGFGSQFSEVIGGLVSAQAMDALLCLFEEMKKGGTKVGVVGEKRKEREGHEESQSVAKKAKKEKKEKKARKKKSQQEESGEEESSKMDVDQEIPLLFPDSTRKPVSFLLTQTLLTLQLNETKKHLNLHTFTHRFHTEYLEPLLGSFKQWQLKAGTVQRRSVLDHVIQPALECHLVLLRRDAVEDGGGKLGQVFDLVKGLQLDSDDALKHGLVRVVVLEIAAVWLEKWGKKDITGDDGGNGVGVLVDWMWKCVLSISDEHDDDGRQLELEWNVVHSFIPTILHYSSQNQAKLYLKTLIRQVLYLKQPKNGVPNSQEAPPVASFAILSHADFWEIEAVYSFFIPCLFQVVEEEFADTVAGRITGEETLDYFGHEFMKPLLETSSSSSQPKKKSKKKEKKKGKNENSFEIGEDLETGKENGLVQWIANVALLFKAIPLTFPTLSQTEAIQYYLCHLLIFHRTALSQPEHNQSARDLGLLLYKYIDRRRDRSVMFVDPILFVHLSRSYVQNGKAAWVCGILEVVIRKCCTVKSGDEKTSVLQKNGAVAGYEFLKVIQACLLEAGSMFLLAAFWRGCGAGEGKSDSKILKSLLEFWKVCWTSFVEEGKDENLGGLIDNMVQIYFLMIAPKFSTIPEFDKKTIMAQIESWTEHSTVIASAQMGYSILLGYFQNVEDNVIEGWMNKFLDTFSSLIEFGRVEPKISKILSKSSAKNYEMIFTLVLERLEKRQSLFLGQTVVTVEACDALVILAQIILVFVKTPHPSTAGRGIIYKNWSRVCVVLSRVVYGSCSVSLIDACFALVTFVAKDKSFELSVAETSVMLSIITSLQTNKSSSILQKQIPRVLDCFDLVYNLLYAILRHRREEMVNLIPQFFSSISMLIECFTSPGTLFHSHAGSFRKTFSGRVSMRPLALVAPLSSSNSKQITRLFLQMTVKAASYSNTNFNSVKPFAKYVPFFLTNLLAIPTSTRWNITSDEWKEWCFVCLDLCDDHGRDMVLASLNHGSLLGMRVIYKNVVSEWEKNHRYKGSRA